MHIGAATANISPVTPQVLGASGTHDPIDAVRDDLEINVVLLRRGKARIALVSMDLLYPGRLIRTGVESALATLWAPQEVFLAASHTHYAPAVDVDKPQLGLVDTRYTQLVIDSIVAAIGKAEENELESSQVTIHSGYASSSINRRRTRMLRLQRRRVAFNEVGLAPNPLGPRNETVTTLVLGDPKRPKAVAWSYACHPTSLPRPYQVSAHFPGHIREGLRAEFDNPALPVLFLQGFSGDVRPPAVSRINSPRSLLSRMRLGPGFGDFRPAEYDAWVGALSNTVLGSLASPGRSLDGGLSVARLQLPLSEFVASRSTSAGVTFHGFAMDSLVVVGVSGEVVTEYSQRLQSHFPGRHAIGVGCIDDTFGYVPTTEMIGTGGYEDYGFCRSFDVGGVQPGIEHAMMHGFRTLASELGS